MAPSPSAACCRARSRATASIARPSASASALPSATPARSRRARGEDEDRVVRARVAVDGQLVPGPRGGRSEERREDRRLDRRVGQDDGQHRRHPRMDHPDALGDPADPDRRPVVPSGPGSATPIVADLGPRVGRPQGGRRALSSPAVGASRPSADSVGQPAPDLVDRQARPDDAGREEQRRVGRDPDRAAASGLGDLAPGRRRRPRRSPRSRSRSSRRSPAPSHDDRRRPDRRPRRGAPGDSRTGAAAKAFGVNDRGRRGGSAVVATMTARSGRPEALIPAAIAPPATKPRGGTGRRSTDGRSERQRLEHGRRRRRSADRRAVPLTARAGAARARASRAGRGPG